MTALLAGMLLASCGASPADDAPLDALPERNRDPFVPAPPAPPEAPRFVCPDGWREVVDADLPNLVTCDPWPEDGPGDCADDEVHLPGTDGCEPIGAECPIGDDFSADAPDDGIFVLAGAAAGGDGTRALPLATIDAAISVAASGDTIAIGRGTYDELLVVNRTLTLLGACVEETTITTTDPATDPADPGILQIAGRGTVAVRNLTVTGPRGGIDVLPGATAAIESVLVRDTEWSGFFVIGANVDAERLVVRRVSGAAASLPGNGFAVGGRSQVTLRRSAIESAQGAGILLQGAGAALDASDVVLRSGRSQGNGQFGRGLTVDDGASATLSRVAIENNRDSGILVSDAARLDAVDLVVRGTTSQDEGHGGGGLVIQRDATVSLERALFSRNRWIGIYVEGTAPDAAWALEASDLAVLDTTAQELDPREGVGMGLQAFRGARVSLSRSVFARDTGVAVMVAEGAELVAQDLRLEGTLPSGAGMGRGLEVAAACATLTRTLVARSTEIGIVGFGGATIVLDDAVVEDTLAPTCELCERLGGGDAIVADVGSEISATRFSARQSARCGIQSLEGTLTLTDGVVQGNRIGANVVTGPYTRFLVETRMMYAQNERNLDAAILPSPTPVVPAEL